jgi:hypothetical protein
MLVTAHTGEIDRDLDLDIERVLEGGEGEGE